MKYINYSEINSVYKLRISAPIFKDNDQDCKVGQNFKFIRDGQKWEIIERHFPVSIKSIKIDTRLVKELQFSTTEQFKDWNGSLLQLSVACGNEEHCVLFKLASLPDVFTVTPSPSSTTTRETSGFEETHYVAIVAAVTLFLLALALGIGYQVYYGRRKRAQVAENNKYDTGFFNCPEAIYEEPDPIYETVTENETPHNQLETSTKEYSYPDAYIITNPVLTENGILKEKGHDVPDNEPEISYIHPDTNRDTKPLKSAVTENEAPREEDHKLLRNQPGKSSDTYIHPDSNAIANPTLTEHDKPTEEECEVPSNVEPEISSGTNVIPNTNTNRNTKPAVNEDETPKNEGHEVLGTLEPETDSDKYIYPEIYRNAKPAVNEYDIPME
ncbi:Hypothetical predicted protein [Paramuricea clavata]|uniref:Uncharacterized protein n=1 Tax=Paramuricea clavata TaxID=317549 RepID=A0A7D9IAM0_PARCT|nr:Hypothetical predicted protein [Paramuricea clavata]